MPLAMLDTSGGVFFIKEGDEVVNEIIRDTPQHSQDVFDAAHDLVEMGISIFPIPPGCKLPGKGFKWKPFSKTHPTACQLSEWYDPISENHFGIALVHGPISGGLTIRDWDDDDEGYMQWCAQHHVIAETLPVVRTGRGFHVWCRTSEAQEKAVRKALKKPEDGVGAIALAGGEMRFGKGCYTIAPPTIHKSGTFQYSWLQNKPSTLDDIPIIENLVELFDLEALDTEDTEDTGLHRILKPLRGEVKQATRVCHLSVDEQIELAIDVTVVVEKGQHIRNRQVFEFARHILAIDGFDKSTPKDVLKAVFRRWYELAKPFIKTKGFYENWNEFYRGYQNVTNPAGQEPIQAAFNAACVASYPACADEFRDEPQVQLLISLCYQLQQVSGDDPFYLDCRTAAKLLSTTEVVSKSTCANWLKGFCADGVLELVKQGKCGGGASEYRFVGAV